MKIMKYTISALIISTLLLVSCGTEVVDTNENTSIETPVVVEEMETSMDDIDSEMTDEVIATEDTPAAVDIVDIAISSADHTTLVAAVQAWGLVETLKSEGPFTVFAPTNAAFDALPAGTVESLLETDNLAQLQWILTYHVIPSKVMAEDLTDGLVAATVQWDELTFTYDNEAWYVNGVAISAANLEGSNGVVHVVDGVLLPPTDS